MFDRFKRGAFLLWVRFRTSEPVKALYAYKADRYRARQRRNNNRWERLNFRLIHGMPLSFSNPQTFNEKICCKKLFDRNPLLTQIADKHLARDYVREKLGSEAEEILIPQLFVTDNPDEIPFDSFEGDYILKANHGSRMNIVVRQGEVLDTSLVKAKLKLWLARDFGISSNQWCYQGIPRKIVVERLLAGADGKVPPDVKLHVFGGKVKLIRILTGRFESEGVSEIVLDGNLNRVGVKSWRKPSENFEVPENINKLIDVAEKLAKNLEYARVDLYSTGNEIFFGEFTNYQASGRKRLKPQKLDYQIGDYWSERQIYLPKSNEVVL